MKDRREGKAYRSECFKNLSAQVLTQYSYSYPSQLCISTHEISEEKKRLRGGERRREKETNTSLEDKAFEVKSLQQLLKHRSTRFWYRAMKSFI